jgi:enterochelin esterase family protein
MMTPSTQLEKITIDSKALRGNRLNDPHIRELVVYLPPGYHESANADRRYPSLYLLSSHGRTSYHYVNWNQWSETLPQRLDRLINSGQMPPVVVALPDCWTRFGGSQFINSPIGKYADYLVEEIVPAVDEHFRTLPDRDHRGVLGHSSGGYGAIVHAMQNPDTFGAVGCRSADMYWEFSALPPLSRLHQQLQKWDGFAGFIEQIPDIHPKRGAFWEAIHTIMQCMAYGPNPDSPLGFDPPIDLETGALVEEVWQRWLQHDPLRMIEQSTHQAALRRMHAIFLEVGGNDEYQLQVGARLLHRRLDELSIDHQFEEFPDGHSGLSYRFDVSFPLLANALSE